MKELIKIEKGQIWRRNFDDIEYKVLMVCDHNSVWIVNDNDKQKITNIELRNEYYLMPF